MTKKTCPLGEDCDLTVAWMAGRERAKDEAQAMVAAALKEAAREIDCGCAHRSEVLAATGVDRWKFCGDPCAALDAREVRALIPDAGAALDRALNEERKAGIAAALEEAADALMECAVWCDSQERIDDGWRNGVADARRHISRHIYIRAAELKGEKK